MKNLITSTKDSLQRDIQSFRTDKKRSRGFCLAIGSAILMFVLIYAFPDGARSVSPITNRVEWAFGATSLATLGFFGVATMMHKSIQPIHLKILDLIWVVGSAVGVTLAVIAWSQTTVDNAKSALEEQIKENKRAAAVFLESAYMVACVSSQAKVQHLDCDSLKLLAVQAGGPSDIIALPLTRVCPRSIDVSKWPQELPVDLMRGCIAANYAAYSREAMIFKDAANVERWKENFKAWSIFMMILVSLRVNKSLIEVFL